MSSDGTPSKLSIIAHRCRGFGYPENSFRAFRSAVQSAVDGLEIDVRLTKDRKWIVTHNPHYRSEQSQTLRVHQRTLRQLRREVTPLDALLAAFSAFGEGKTLFIDVKDVGEERQLLQLLRRHNVTESTVIIGWEYEILKRVHKLDPAVRIGFSFVPIHRAMERLRGASRKPISKFGILISVNDPESFDPKTAIGHTHQHYLSTIPNLPLYSIQVPGVFCSKRLVREAHERSILVIPFFTASMGVNNRVVANALRRQGVDGILSDDPKRFSSAD